MKIGIVGLGKMGLHMAARLMKRGHTVVGTDRRPGKSRKLEEAGGEAVKTCKDLAVALEAPRVVWLMVIDGLLLVLFAFNRDIRLAMLIFAAFGAIGSVGQVAIATFLQRETPEDYRGRVFGWLGTWIGPLSLVSVFLGPLAAGVVGAAAILALSGTFELVIGLAGRFALRRVTRAPPVPSR